MKARRSLFQRIVQHLRFRRCYQHAATLFGQAVRDDAADIWAIEIRCMTPHMKEGDSRHLLVTTACFSAKEVEATDGEVVLYAVTRACDRLFEDGLIYWIRSGEDEGEP